MAYSLRQQMTHYTVNIRYALKNGVIVFVEEETEGELRMVQVEDVSGTDDSCTLFLVSPKEKFVWFK